MIYFITLRKIFISNQTLQSRTLLKYYLQPVSGVTLSYLRKTRVLKIRYSDIKIFSRHLAHQSYPAAVSAKLLDILHHPLQGRHLVHQPIVSNGSLGHRRRIRVEKTWKKMFFIKQATKIFLIKIISVKALETVRRCLQYSWNILLLLVGNNSLTGNWIFLNNSPNTPNL